MRALERFPEPWTVEDRGDSFAITDASGCLLASIPHWQDLHQSSCRGAASYLSVEEALRLAHLIVRLPVLARRPQY